LFICRYWSCVFIVGIEVSSELTSEQIEQSEKVNYQPDLVEGVTVAYTTPDVQSTQQVLHY